MHGLMRCADGPCKRSTAAWGVTRHLRCVWQCCLCLLDACMASKALQCCMAKPCCAYCCTCACTHCMPLCVFVCVCMYVCVCIATVHTFGQLTMCNPPTHPCPSARSCRQHAERVQLHKHQIRHMTNRLLGLSL